MTGFVHDLGFGLFVIVISVVLLRITGIALRRFEVGRVVISLASKLMWLYLVGIFGSIIGHSQLEKFIFFALLLFLQMSPATLVQSLFQLVGMVAPYFYHRFNLPSKDNYTQKADYILPFKGKWTVVNGGTDKNLSHSWGILSQRYAYDFIILDDKGKSYSGDKMNVANYYCYGQDIIAPADGVVVNLYDKCKDTFVDGRNAYCDSNRIEGNFITIKHADSEYSMIAHILRGSITVKIGDTVKQGEIIAKCGNSGNTSEPHIHFQLQAGESFLLSAGLPVLFSEVTAYDKENYSLLDKRSRAGNLQVVGNKSYIGRGLEVANKAQ